MDELQSSAPLNRFERRRQRNRDRLIESALELFQDRGLHATKLEEVCERADVAPRTFFNHFESREHLYRAIAERRAVQLAATIDAAGAAAGPVGDRLGGLFARLGAYLDARPRYRELVGEMLNLRRDGSSEVARERSLGLAARRFVEAGRSRGEIGSQHPPEILADLMLGTLTNALTNWCSSESFELEPELSAAAAVLADAFRPAQTDNGPSDDPAGPAQPQDRPSHDQKRFTHEKDGRTATRKPEPR